MIELIVVGLVAGAGGFVAGVATGFFASRRAQLAQAMRPALPVKEHDVLRAGLRDVRKGGLIRLPGFGDDYEDVDLEVERYDKVALGRLEWHVLEGTYKNRPVGVGWQDERGAVRAYALKRLHAPLAEAGVTPAAVESLAATKSLAAGGAAYDLEDQGKAQRHENGTGFGKEHQAWFLATKDRAKVLRLERWGDEQPRVTLGEQIEPTTVEIYKVRA